MNGIPKIISLDHAALLVKNMDVSTKWYKDVLGLRAKQVKDWGSFPILMLAENDTGLALFPSTDGNPLSADARTPHFAFRVNNNEFHEFQKHLNVLGIPFVFQDHSLDHSIYLRDPDNYLIEITVHL